MFEDEAASASAPAASAAVSRGERLLAEGDAEGAEAAFREAIAQDAADPRAHLDLGLALELQERFEEAEAAYRAALEVDADFTEALNNLGVLLRDSGRVGEAITTFERAVEVRPGFASAHLNLGLALEDEGDVERAMAAYRRVIEIAPREPTARVQLGLLQLSAEQTEAALITLRRAMESAQGSRAMLTALGNGLRRAGDPQMPGPRGLSILADAAQAHGAKAVSVRDARAAIQSFDEAIRELAGSLAGLVRRIQLRTGSGGEPRRDDEAARTALFEAAGHVTGRTMDTLLSMHFLRLDPSDPNRIEAAGAQGQIGVEVHPGGLPFASVFVSGSEEGSNSEQYGAIDGDEAGATPSVLLADFSTQPLPAVTSKDENGVLTQLIDPDRTLAGRPIDLVVANRRLVNAEHPRLDDPPRIDLYTVARVPARYLILDAWLEEDLVRGSIAELSTHAWSPTIGARGWPQWYDRLPAGNPNLELLGRGLGASATAGYGRHTELTRALFDRLGWDPERFVGHRCQLAFPVWGACYRISWTY